MKKILSFVLFCCLFANVAIAEIDLSSMEDYQLILLREQINDELNSRKPVIPEDESKRRRDISDHFEDLAYSYSYQTIIDEINSGGSGLSSECQADILSFATKALSALEELNIEKDIFSGELLIKSPLAMQIGGDTAVVPYLTKGYLGMIVGFKYDDSFSYDKILLKVGEDVQNFFRDKFDIEFERIDGDSWEYTYLSYVGIPDGDHLEAVGFREDDTTRKIDYIPTEAEKQAVDSLALIDNINDQIHQRVLSWRYNPDPSEQ